MQWKSVPNFVGLYEVSTKGHLRSLDRWVRTLSKDGVWRKRLHKGKILKPSISCGYRVAGLSKNGIITQVKVSRLVLEVFVGPCPKGMECCHGDGDSQNDDLTNLRWATPLENHQDKKRHGTTNQGEKTPQSKLKTADVIFIKENKGIIPISTLAKFFGVRYETIWGIYKGLYWNHIQVGLPSQPSKPANGLPK